MMDRGGHHMMDGVHYMMDRVHHMMDGVHHMMGRLFYVFMFLYYSICKGGQKVWHMAGSSLPSSHILRFLAVFAYIYLAFVLPLRPSP